MIVGLGKRLRQLRKTKKLTQKQVAERVGVTRTVLSQYENDHTAPSLEVLVKLANQFGVSTDYLLDNISPSEQSKEEAKRRMLLQEAEKIRKSADQLEQLALSK